MKTTKQILLAVLLLFSVTEAIADWTLTSGVGTRYGNTLYTIGETIFAGTDSGAYRSTNNGLNWTLINNGFHTTTHRAYDFAYNNGKLWCATSNTGPYYSTNNGDLWIREFSYTIDHSYSIEASDQYVYAGHNSSMKYTTNLGQNWTNMGSTTDGRDGLVISNNNVFAVSFGDIYKSVLGSTNWVSIRGNLAANIDVLDLRFKNNILYIATNRGVWNSTNEGTDWSNINIFNFSTHFTAIDLINTHVIASTQSKVYITADNGSNWADITGALPVTSNNEISEIAYNSNYVFVILENTGFVYRRPRSEIIIGITSISSNVPDKYSLSQNYPNPFNPTTNINFNVPKSGLVKMIVYDINGREISTLVNQEMTPGSYKVDFDGSSLSSGIYYYTLTSGDFVETKKMMLVK